MNAREPVFFFVHLQKTAGTSLVFRLRHHFGREGVYPRDSDKTDPGAVISVDHLSARWRDDGESIRVITGHFPLCTTEVLGGAFTTLTVLREPVERTLSYLRHHKDFEADDDRTIEEVYADPFRFHGLVHNHMVKMFSLNADEMTAGMLTRVEFADAHLERAKKNLASVDMVGVQERFEEFCTELERRYGWDLGPPTVMNRTQSIDVPDAFRDRIVDDNALDVELYEFAVRLVRERRVSATGEAAPDRARGTRPPG